MKSFSCKLLALAALLSPLTALADRYRVDAIVFLNPPADEVGVAPQHPDNGQALALDDSTGLSTAGLTLLPEAGFALTAEWNNLRAAHRYTPLLKLSWLQDSPPADGGPALRIYLPSGDGISGLDGWLRLSAGRFPHMDADLEYVHAVDGVALAWRLRDKRKAADPSLIYLDSARVGVLAKVVKQ